MSLRLAPYDAAWLPALLPMWRASFEQGVGIVDPHPLHEQQAFFETQVLPHHAVCLALDDDAPADGQLVGFVAASADTLSQLYVRVGRHREGIGELLLEWAKAFSDGRLVVHTFARNAGARAFYARQGFKEVAQGFEPMWQLDDVRLEWAAPTLAR
jgi:GNAT superfamily N-acetyltransferase